MNPEQNLSLIHRVVTVCERLDDDECLCWSAAEDGTVHPWLIVNDAFMWACADSESITLDNIAGLEQACADVLGAVPKTVESIGAGNYPRLDDVAVLFAARNRQLRPFKHKGTYGIAHQLDKFIEELPPREFDSDGRKVAPTPAGAEEG